MMFRISIGLALGIAAAAAVAAEPNAEPVAQKIETVIIESPPCAFPDAETTAVDLMQRAATCLDEKKMAEAIPIYFAGQIRLRTLAILDKNPDGSPAMLSSFTYAFGPAVNGWAGGDIPAWMIALNDAIDWDKKTAFKELDEVALKNFRNVAEARDIHGRVNASIYTLIGKIRDDKVKIYVRRDEQQFLVRDPWWTDEERKLAKQALPMRPTAEGLVENLKQKSIKERFESGNMPLIEKGPEPGR